MPLISRFTHIHQTSLVNVLICHLFMLGVIYVIIMILRYRS